MTKTKFDLSTLSDITDGTHTVKVKAKADGYIDSEFSNEVNWVKLPQTVTFTLDKESHRTGDDAATYIKLDNAPANANDYDYRVEANSLHDSDHLYNKAGAVVSGPITLSARCVYVWGFQVYVNNRGQSLYASNKTYDNALEIILSQNDNIKLECRYRLK